MKQHQTLFADRHIGLSTKDIKHMLDTLGYNSLDELIKAVVPASILETESALDGAVSEEQALQELADIAKLNQVKKSLIGQGYYGTFTPKVIQRNVLENPAWYTSYTPYQPEISQGRLEVLFYFQTMITELTGMDIANASLLDEATAASEAMTLAHRALKARRNTFLVSKNCHAQTREILSTRAHPLGIELVEIDETDSQALQNLDRWADVFGVLVQYPDTNGTISELSNLSEISHEMGALVIMASDLLALTLLTSPSELGADIVIGNSQRFGVPLGFGGPHAGFFAVKDKYKRSMPGRLVGQSLDVHGNPAFRLALQTREQHIRREKATSNICTAQALLAIMATLFACYQGPQGLRAIAHRVNQLALKLSSALTSAGFKCQDRIFDTVTTTTDKADQVVKDAETSGYNFRQNGTQISISLDETCDQEDVLQILKCFGIEELSDFSSDNPTLPKQLLRTDSFMSQAVFHDFRSETEMMRYLRRLSDKDIALDRAMIPLGSCTMKLNSASEMTPITWPEFSNIHPFAPPHQSLGYQKMINQLEDMLCACTGYDAVSLQPNAGSQGEYAGLLAIKAYHESRGDFGRDVCLIPSSAHGTNPASAQMANMQVVVVKCDDKGDVDLTDLAAKIADHKGRVAAIMITYPSTHGVFEEGVRQVCEAVHQEGGQVYIDGANLNALAGVALPGKFGGDVSHLNLHKTFCIPHGGGGPGVGPVAVGKHLEPFLPRDNYNQARQGSMISAAPFGSASILPISWMYIRMMGASGIRRATQIAILSANYVAHRLKDQYPILFTGKNNLVAHECIIDTRPMKDHGVSVDDIAKRLIDYGFHAPTMSFPVPGTLMIEPTESESLAELERFCRAMHGIFNEYQDVREGKVPADNNLLSNAPHTMSFLMQDDLTLPYSRLMAAQPDEQADYSVKYWPPVGRVDNVFGDKNLVCSCPSMENYETDN